MAYIKTNWTNNQPPAINATNLNKIEQGIYDAHENINILLEKITKLTKYDDSVQIVKITNSGITLGQIKTQLDTINENEEHVFFDVSALGAKMYLCTISIDTVANTYTIFDLVLGRTASGDYSSDKLLTIAIAQADNIATQSQINHLQDEIDEIGGSERIKNLEALGNLILSGDSPDYIKAGDSILFNWVKTVIGSTTHGLTVTCSDADKFINGVGECEERDYLLVFNGTSWTYNEEVISLAEWGLSVTGTPQTGEVMTINVTVDPVEHVFTGYDDMVPHDPSVPHNWVMEQKYAPTTKILDAEEALFTVYEGKTIPAGNYHLRKYCVRSGFNIDMYFTLASAMGNADNKVQACYSDRLSGQTIVNADGVEKTGVYIITKFTPKIYGTGASAGSAVNIAYSPASGVSYTELASLNVDEEDPVIHIGHNQSYDKSVLGNNNWDLSTLSQWLNDDTMGDNYVPSHLNDVACSYNRSKGYLWGLDPRVKALMLDADIKCIAGYGDEGYTQGQIYTTTKKVFLLSMKEMSFNIATEEGNATDLYSEYTEGVLHNNACEGRAKYNKAGGTLNSNRWSRSANSSNANVSFRVFSTGAYYNDYAYNAYYFAPAFIIGKPASNI